MSCRRSLKRSNSCKNVGAQTIGDCLALPRDGLARRLGQELLDDIDRACGKLPDPRPFFTPPSVFKAAQPLPRACAGSRNARVRGDAVCSSSSAVIFRPPRAARSRLTFFFAHHRREATRVVLSLTPRRATRII
jgi:protein ImuB